jgi:hypothetical protein
MKRHLEKHKIKIVSVLLFLVLSLLIALLLLALTGVKTKESAVAADKGIISVSNIGDSDNPAYVIYWNKSNGSVKVERGENNIYTFLSDTTESYFVDYTASPDTEYTYRITRDGEVLVINSKELSTGKPEINNIKFEAGTTSKTEASVIVTFQTDKLSRSQVFYGEDATYGFQSEMKESLNQSHTILIEKLKPETTYHLKIRAQDRFGEEVTESTDQTFTTASQPNQKTVLEIIIEALSRAFAGFDSWFRS